MRENPEQLKALLGSFLYPESADKAVEDIDGGLDLLRAHPAPKPDPARIASIKRELRLRIGHKRPAGRISAWIGWSACAAAILLVAAFLTLRDWPMPRPNLQISDILNPIQWKIDTDPVLSGMTEDLGNGIEGVHSIYPDQYNPEDPDTLEKLQRELKMMASTDDFWKG